MAQRLQLAFCLTLGLAVATTGPAPDAQGQALAALRTRAERTNYRETSRYDDVQAFLEAVDEASPIVHVTTFGRSFEGRALPLAVAGRVADASPATVRASGKLRVYIQANVHAGEVEGKEAMQALLRELALGRYAAWMDSMVLLVAPIYNADGNERVSMTSRGPQHGPIAGAGQRANAQGLNINRDHMKLETPEARAMVGVLREYDPHVMLDLHTTNGSRHAYHLTFETPNNPAADPAIVGLARARWMTAVARAVKASDGWDYRAYGNVEGQPPARSWNTVEDLPRYSHNYWGIRNRVGILMETYSYLPFPDRISAARRFVEEVLHFAHANAGEIRHATEAADARSVIGERLSLRSRPRRSPEMVEILMGATAQEANPLSGRMMERRLDVRTPERMWEYATFESVESERVPTAYYVPQELRSAVERLQAHGIVLERLPEPATLALEEFAIQASEVTARAFENHRERTLTGRYRPVERTLPAATWRVPMRQRLARLAFQLLEPRSPDGVVAWNVLDEALQGASAYPILRIP